MRGSGIRAGVLALALVGCDTQTGGTTGTNTGGETEETDETNGTVGSETGGEILGCGEEWTTVVSDLEQEITGFSRTPAEVLEVIGGTRVGTFTWEQIDGPISTPYAGTQTPVTWEVAPTGGVRYVEVELHGQFPDNNPGGFYCTHRLEFDVQLTMTSEDGVFAIDAPSVVTVEIYSQSNQPNMSPSLIYAIDFTSHEGLLSASDFTVGEGELQAVYIYASGLDAVIDGGLSIDVLYDWGYVGAWLGTLQAS